jgi:hypothetical protein
MKFYTKKADSESAYWFAKCPKTDSDPSVQDGRFLRSWEFKGERGQTLGWKVPAIEGRINGVAVKALNEDLFLNLTVGEDLVQFKLYCEDILSICQILASINLNVDIKLVPYLKPKKAWKNSKSGKMITPVGLSIKQNNEWLSSLWPYNQELRWFEGLPKPEIVRSALGIETKDFSKQHAAFNVVIAEFMDRCAEELDAEPDEIGVTVISASGGEGDEPF